MYTDKLFSSDLVWPCHHDMDSGQYMLCIGAQIEKAYNFLSEVLASTIELCKPCKLA